MTKNMIGKSVKRIDAWAKVLGKAKYTEDLIPNGALIAVIMHSTIANGLIKSIDISEAEKLAGVELIVTYDDVPDILFGTPGHPYGLIPEHKDVEDRKLLNQRVRFYGDDIAVVVARDEVTACKALKLIKVEYESYSPVFTPEEALKEGASQLHEANKGNISGKWELMPEGIEAAFAKADKIIEGTFKVPPICHCHLEKVTSHAYTDADGKIVVVSSTQSPHVCRRVISQALGISWGRVRVIKPYIGGGFGNKNDVLYEPLTAFLASKLPNNIVTLSLSYEESMVGTRTRHGMEIKLKTGINNDGTILARTMELVSNTGAYASHGHIVAINAAAKYRQLYPNALNGFKLTTVYTNIATAGAMRGYGIPQVMFAMEAHMEDIASQLEKDTIEIHLKNLIASGYKDQSGCLETLDCGLQRCIEKGKTLLEWDKKRRLYQEQSGEVRRGIGMACYCYETGVYPHSVELAGARMILNQDGTVQIQTGATEIGQGSDTVLVQMAAEVLKMPMENFYLLSTQDTDITPYDPGAFASRQTYISGHALKLAAEQLKDNILKKAAEKLSKNKEDLELANSWIIAKNSEEKLLSLEELSLYSYYDLEKASVISADISNSVQSNALTFGCTFVEVEVDMAVGSIQILNLYNIHDAGKIINPQLAEAQVHGGVSMALGYALSEQLLFDEQTGKPLNNNFLDYKLFTMMDMPKVSVEFIETDEITGPFGNKSLGETPVLTPAPAIRNAVYHATGVTINELPLTPQRLISGFKKANKI